jgi:hypothetical protein
MQNLLTVVVILAMIGVGAFLITRLNGRHDERIATFIFSRSSPGARERPRSGAGASAPHPYETPGPALAHGTRRDHRDGGRGRTSQRRHLARGRGAAGRTSGRK